MIHYRILVVDDNPSIHEDIKKILKDEFTELKEDQLHKIKSHLFGEEVKRSVNFKYIIDSASQGEEAVKLVKKSKEEDNPYSLIFMDVVMPPGLDGIETIKRIWQIDEEIQVIICTAYGDYSWDDIIRHLGINDNFLIIKKPFENIEIRQMACCLTKKWSLGHEAGHKFDRLHQEIMEETKKLKKSFEDFDKRSDISHL